MGAINIAFGIDAGYLPWCATAARSVLDRHGAEADITVVHDGTVTGQGRVAMESMVEGAGATVRFLTLDPGRVAGLPAMDRFGQIVWSRFFLPELLPELDRVLYLDADTLVVDRLDDLLGTDLEGLPLGAVANVVDPHLHAHVRAIGVRDPRRFLNSGVLLLDLARMRAEGSTAALVAVASARADELRWPDQDALNIAFDGRWKALHPRWNAMNSLWDWEALAADVFGRHLVAAATAAPGILHFEGPSLCKPWHTLSQHPWRDTYWETLRRTPWADTEPEDRTVATRLIAHLPAARRASAYRRVVRWRAARASA